MTEADWTEAHVNEALSLIPESGMSHATLAVLRCRKREELARIIRPNSTAAPIYTAEIKSPRMTSVAKREYRRVMGKDLPEYPRSTADYRVRLTPRLVEMLAAAGIVEELIATCSCGDWDNWKIPHTWVMGIVANPPVRGPGVSRGIPSVIVPDEYRPGWRS